MGDAEKSRRPDDTDFKQQRLKAWQPILTPNWVIGTFAIVGLIFIPIGVVLKNESDSIIEHRFQYDGKGTPAPATGNCGDVDPATGEQTKSCTISFNIDKKMTKPVYVYYQLDNFYQNHRRYVKSRSDAQLRGETVVSSDLEDCAPLTEITLEGQTTPKSLSPCGLIANSLFNDTIALTAAPTGVSMTQSGIAWKSDIDKKFKNGNEAECTAACTLAVCEAARTGTGTIADRDSVAYAPCKDACPWQETTTHYGFDTYPTIIPKYPYDPAFDCKNGEQYGVTNEHFVVWMRTAGLPNFRKLYGKIDQDLEAGTTLTFDVVASFPVTAFGGKKFVVISTTSWFGGKNPFLGIAYITVGALCLCLSALFLIKHKMSPRKLGDTRYLVWKNR